MTVGTPTGIDVDDIDSGTGTGPEPVAHELDTVSKPPPLVLVVFGASGDLAARKLLPAIAGLADHGALAEGFTVVGVARTTWSDEDFQKVALKAVPKPSDAWKELVKRFRYIAGEYGHPDTFDQLKTVLDESDKVLGTAGSSLYRNSPPNPSANSIQTKAAKRCSSVTADRKRRVLHATCPAK